MLAILIHVGTKPFADLDLNSFYILIFGELILFPMCLVKKAEKVIVEPRCRISTAKMWKILRKIEPYGQTNIAWPCMWVGSGRHKCLPTGARWLKQVSGMDLVRMEKNERACRPFKAGQLLLNLHGFCHVDACNLQDFNLE